MRGRLKKVTAFVAVLTLGAIAFPSPASAVSNVSASPPSGPPGSNFTVTGTCANPAFLASQATAAFPVPVNKVSGTVSGVTAINFTVPDSTPPGVYQVTVECAVIPVFLGLDTGQTTFTVTAPITSAADTTDPGLIGLDVFDFGPAEPVDAIPRFTG